MADWKRNQEALRSFFERPGFVLMLSVWMQSQMIDLLILKRHPDLQTEFLNSDASNPIPKLMVRERADYTTESLQNIVKAFEESFKDLLSERCIRDLKETVYIRNAIAHAQLKTGRASGDFLLYYPNRQSVTKEFIDFFDLVCPENPSDPPMFTLRFDDERYDAHRARYVRLEECFSAIANSMDIPYEKLC